MAGGDGGKVEGLLNPVCGYLATKLDAADLPGQHEPDFTTADFFVMAHGGKKFFAPRRIQFDIHRQAGGLEQILNAQNVARRQTGNLLRQARRRDCADGNRLPMQVFAIAGNVFQGMANGVAEI